MCKSKDKLFSQIKQEYKSSYKPYYELNLKHKYTTKIRKIAIPSNNLKDIQKKICNLLLNKCSTHTCAHAYIKKRSIHTNIKSHLNQNSFFKIDLKDFFFSITQEMLIKYLEKNSFEKDDSKAIAHCCTYKGSLPQGAPSSPYISNLILYSLDKKLYTIAKKNMLSYTRYADDMAFSGDDISLEIEQEIRGIIKQEGFIINKKKTYISRKAAKRILTGISIVGAQGKLPTKTRRKLSQTIFYIQKYGLNSHLKKINEFNNKEKYLASLLGKLNFWLQVEPSHMKVSECIKEIKVELLALKSANLSY